MRYGILFILMMLSACSAKRESYECKHNQIYVYEESMNVWVATGKSCLKAEEIGVGK